MVTNCYKCSVIQGFVYRIYRTCISWEKCHESLIKPKDILEWNQYPPNFYQIFNEKVNCDDANNENSSAKVNSIMQYQGLPTDNFIKQLKRSNTPIQPVVTLRKQKTFLPSLKPNVKEELKSSVMCKIICPGCHACYICQTSRHMITRFKEHSNQKSKPVRKHFDICIGAKLQITSVVKILASLNRNGAPVDP